MLPVLDDILQLEPLKDARVLTAPAALSRREVSSVGVIHWPAMEFAREGELVLTTGAGCRERDATRFVAGIAERRAAALAVTLPPDAQRSDLTEESLARAEADGLPIMRLPWSVSFADVMQAVTERLSAERRTAVDGAEHGGPHELFARVVLDGTSHTGIAAALEARTGRGALVFDARWRLAGHGPRAARQLSAAQLARLRAGTTTEDALEQLCWLDRPRRLHELPGLQVGAGIGLAAVARHRPAGFVHVLDPRRGDASRAPSSAADAATLHAAAIAVALEAMRLSAGAMAETSMRERIMWHLLTRTGVATEEAVDHAAAIGWDAGARYDVAIGRVTDAVAGDSHDAALERLRRFALRRGIELTLSRRDDAIAAVAPCRDGVAPLRELLTSADTRPIDWGLAATPRPLARVADAYAEATRALRAGRALGIEPGELADAASLQPYMLLGQLGEDPYATRIAAELLAPLLEYDAETGRNLLETLEVYLHERGNTSSAARRLFMNRHSLLYRLRKIEALTGRSLDRPTDRFVLETSVRLHRLGAMPAPA